MCVQSCIMFGNYVGGVSSSIPAYHTYPLAHSCCLMMGFCNIPETLSDTISSLCGAITTWLSYSREPSSLVGSYLVLSMRAQLLCLVFFLLWLTNHIAPRLHLSKYRNIALYTLLLVAFWVEGFALFWLELMVACGVLSWYPPVIIDMWRYVSKWCVVSLDLRVVDILTLTSLCVQLKCFPLAVTSMWD